MQRLANLDGLPELPPDVSVVDSHCHLDMAAFDADLGEVLSRAAGARVDRMVTIGAGGPMQCNHRAIELASEHRQVFATVGIHPHNASSVDDDRFDQIAGLAEHPRVVGIGETGLDYHYDNSPRPSQRDAFRRFVGLARQKGLPLVVHLRNADSDALDILREERAAEVGGVIHCFSSDAAAARQFLDLGFHLSFSGIVSFKAAEDVREAARGTPSDRILVETDAPFLAPVPQRGRRNEPALVVHTASALAEARGEPIEAVCRATTDNARRVFGGLAVD